MSVHMSNILILNFFHYETTDFGNSYEKPTS